MRRVANSHALDALSPHCGVTSMRATAILALGAATCLKVTTADCDAITLADVRSSPGFPTGADAAACAITAAAPSCTLSACAAGYSATVVGGRRGHRVLRQHLRRRGACPGARDRRTRLRGSEAVCLPRVASWRDARDSARPLSPRSVARRIRMEWIGGL